MAQLALALVFSFLSFAAVSKERKPDISISLEKSSAAVLSHFKEQNNCAKIPLAAIYSAQSAYHLENLRFADSFNQVGYAAGTKEEKACAHWKVTVRSDKSGASFVATAQNSLTGEAWKIDDTKKLLQENKGQP